MSVDNKGNINDREAAENWQSNKSQYPNLDVLVQPDEYMLARLPPTLRLPTPLLELISNPPAVEGSEPLFCTVSRTHRELSILVSTGTHFSATKLRSQLGSPGPEDEADGFGIDGPWRAFRIRGPMQFHLVGVLLEFSKCLAAHSISIFAVSTWDTDYICVKQDNFDAACDALKQDGWNVVHAAD
ncbi:amino acid-binding act domain-containing protein [Moesziomyces antarcticus]|uniref:CASTOR ACT domain-containing protein n=1 Tax=Pseudozyma antarctica TaxID=84753 RepID=A0A5C3FEM2_PSEA2|nr:amino acid-binding act domain-containing protein [Moesziomyces antarcticus]GAK62328.1 amino acid-binding act domain-containing protein [Moesziomyces antarcticus]SPO42872.1 uncharacterized protein PSANT_00556 [Moesziomyces antarcticus]